MKVIAVRTDKPLYMANITGSLMRIVATVQSDSLEGGMYKLQAYIKKAGDSPLAWSLLGPEQWSTPKLLCVSAPIANVGSFCGDDIAWDVAIPSEPGKFVIGVRNINDDRTAGRTIDESVMSTGAYTYITVLPSTASEYGLLRVYSTPSGADIIIDGQAVGGEIAGSPSKSFGVTASGASQDIPLTSGIHGVTLKKFGYSTYSTTVTIASREITPLVAKLTELPPGSAPVAAVGTAFAVDPLATVQESVAGIANEIAKYTPYIIAGVGGLVLLYALSKPRVRGKAVEYAARGGRAARVGAGGIRDVGAAALRGAREGGREAASRRAEFDARVRMIEEREAEEADRRAEEAMERAEKAAIARQQAQAERMAAEQERKAMEEASARDAALRAKRDAEIRSGRIRTLTRAD